MSLFIYPPQASGGGSGSNASVGSNGQTAPGSATEIAGVNGSGNLTPVSVDNSGNQNVNVVASVLPTSAATASNQTTGNSSLSSIDTKTPALQSGNVPVQLPSSQVTALTPPTTVTVTQPTGSNLHTVIDSGTVTLSGTSSVSVTNFPATQPVSGSVSVSNFPATQPVSGTVAVSSLPAVSVSNFPVTQKVSLGVLNGTTASAAAANADIVAALDVSAYGALSVQVTGTWVGTLTFQGSNDNTNFVSVNAQTTASGASAVVQTTTANGIFVVPVEFQYFRCRMTTYTSGTANGVMSAFAQPVQDMGQRSVTTASGSTVAVSSATNVTINALPAGTSAIGKLYGRTQSFAPIYNAYATTNVTTSAYTQLIASTTAASNRLDIFDSSGQAMILATGAAGSEVILAYIPPGGLSFDVVIAASTRLAIKALTANATSGYILVDGWA